MSQSKDLMTSETHPLRVDFLKSEEFPLLNKLGLTFAPGKKQKDAISGGWNRDLAVDLSRLRNDYHTDTLVSLVEENELIELGIHKLQYECLNYDLELIRFPLRDVSVPPLMKNFAGLIQEIVKRLEQKKTVVIHCKGGLGRAGLTAACSIVAICDNKISGSESIKMVRQVRKGAIETQEQEKFVTLFGEYWKLYYDKTENILSQQKTAVKETNDDFTGDFDGLDEDENWVELLEHFRQLTIEQPYDADAHYNVGVACDANDLPEEAIAAYLKAIELDPDYWSAHYNLGQNYLRFGELDKSEHSFQNAIRLAPEFAPAIFMLGVVYGELGDFVKAISTTKEGLQLDAEDPKAHFNVGNFYFHLRDYEKAARWLESSAEIEPHAPDTFYKLGKCYRHLGEKKKEFDAYLQTVELVPDFADALFALGTVYAHLTKTEQGKRVPYFETNGELILSDARVFFYMGLGNLALGNVEDVREGQINLGQMDKHLADQLQFFIDQLDH